MGIFMIIMLYVWSLTVIFLEVGLACKCDDLCLFAAFRYCCRSPRTDGMGYWIYASH